MSKHTPGPWKKYDSAFPQFFVTTGGKDICKVSSEDVSLLEAEANARLIAASPDLLEALIDARAQLIAYEFADSGEDYNSPSINAAIAKARGEA